MRGGTVLIWGRAVKGQGQICPLVRGCHALRCLVIFWLTMMILDACVGCDPKSNPIDFGVKDQGQTWKVWICCRRWYLSLLGQISFSLVQLPSRSPAAIDASLTAKWHFIQVLNVCYFVSVAANQIAVFSIKSVNIWPDCKAIPAYGLMMSVCLSVRPSVRLSVNILVNLCV